jgi:hypothetical protein
MSAPERLDDAEREALAEWFHAQWCNSAHHRAEFCRMQVASLDADKADALLASDWLAQRVARVVAEAKAEAWDEGWAARAEYADRRDVPVRWPDLNPYRADREGQS